MTGFPPLPHPTRITVERADLSPEPVLDLSVKSAVPPVVGAAILTVAAVGTLAMAAFPLWAQNVTAWAGREPVELLAGFACSAVLLLGGVTVGLPLVDLSTRLGLRATRDGIVADRVWFGRVRSETVPLSAEGGEVRTVPVIDCCPVPAPDAGVPLFRRRADGKAAGFTPALTAPDRAWLAAALARFGEAAGVPGALPPDPALTTVPAGPAATHPRVRVTADGPGRLALSFPAWFGTTGETLGAVAFGGALAAGGPALWAAIGLPAAPDYRAVALLLGGLPTAAGLAHLGQVRATVRVTVGRDRRGRVRVRRSAGVGPVRCKTEARMDAVLVVAAGPAADAERFAPADRSRAWLVKRRTELSDGLVPLVAAAPDGDGGRFAAAVAGRVAAKLGDFGWTPNPPVDWRFGWVEPGGEP